MLRQDRPTVPADFPPQGDQAAAAARPIVLVSDAQQERMEIGRPMLSAD
jgi:hypothetical protein